MKKYYKNKENNELISIEKIYKSNVSKCIFTGSLFVAVAGCAVSFIGVVGTTVYSVAYGESQTWDEANKCNMIIANDGEINVFKEIDSPLNPSTAEKKSFSRTYKVPFEKYDWKTYEISSLSSNSCIIFVYADDENSRADYTDFILSNIDIDQNKTLFFNEENITNENYESYLLEKEEAPQRKRV